MQSVEELKTDLNRIGPLVARLLERTEGMAGKPSDPKMVAGSLFIRSWGHFVAFTTLWEKDLVTECQILLRASVEVAICMENVLKRPAEFIVELNQDAVKTMDGQINTMREASSEFAEDIAAESLRVFGDVKGKTLVWKELAQKVDARTLYMFHRALSGTAAHVTGISILRPISGEDEDTIQSSLVLMTLGWMVSTMLATCLAYSSIIGANDIRTELAGIIVTATGGAAGPQVFD